MRRALARARVCRVLVRRDAPARHALSSGGRRIAVHRGRSSAAPSHMATWATECVIADLQLDARRAMRPDVAERSSRRARGLVRTAGGAGHKDDDGELHNTRETSASRNAGFAVLSTKKAWNLDGAGLIGVARGGSGAKTRWLGLLRQGCSVFHACFSEGGGTLMWMAGVILRLIFMCRLVWLRCSSCDVVVM